ncbi:hypothetical protein HDU76_001727 [Blyttiomyces sp. JEL0837]|nr:hypothetical protein HDU76_001727 [Blyttiomyces sp. JEL0837]
MPHEGPNVVFSPSLATVKEEKHITNVGPVDARPITTFKRQPTGITPNHMNMENMKSSPASRRTELPPSSRKSTSIKATIDFRSPGEFQTTSNCIVQGNLQYLPCVVSGVPGEKFNLMETVSPDVMIVYPMDGRVYLSSHRQHSFSPAQYSTLKPNSLDRTPKFGGSKASICSTAVASDGDDTYVYHSLDRSRNPNSSRLSSPLSRESTISSAVSNILEREHFSSGHALRAQGNTFTLIKQSEMHGRGIERDRNVDSNAYGSNPSSRSSSRRGSLDSECSTTSGSIENRIDTSSRSGSFVSFANSAKSNGSASSSESATSRGSTSSGGSRMTSKNRKLGRTETSLMRQSTTMSGGANGIDITSMHDGNEYFSESASKARNPPSTSTNPLRQSSFKTSAILDEFDITSMHNTDGSSSYQISREPTRKITEYSSTSRRRSSGEGTGIGWDSSVDPAFLCECLDDYTSKKGYTPTPSGSVVGSRRTSLVVSPETLAAAALASKVENNGGLKPGKTGKRGLKKIFEKLFKFAIKMK